MGSQRRINRVFDLMGIEYDDRPVLAEQKDIASERAKGKKPILTMATRLLRQRRKGLLLGSGRLPNPVMCDWAANW